MRRVFISVFMIFCMVFLLVGCGFRSQSSALKDLQQLRQNLPSYQTQATMTVHTSPSSTQNYIIETKYQSPTAYKISLANSNNQVNQIVIRNSEGLFVVSPQTKKTFRFQGDWVENQGQAYLYHLLLDNLLRAKDIQYSTAKDGSLLFSLPMAQGTPWVVRQNVTLDGKTLFPKQLQYLDKDGKVVVAVTYSTFKTHLTFAESEFQTASALAMASTDLPVSASPQGGSFVTEPKDLPAGIQKISINNVTSDQVIIRYQTNAGIMTLEENRAVNVARSTLDPSGKVYDLYGIPAVASSSDAGTILQWTNHGTEYTLISKLPLTEMWQVAKSLIQ